MPIPAILAGALPIIGKGLAAGAATAAGAAGINRLIKGKKARPGTPEAAQQAQQGNWFSGTPGFEKQFQRFTPEQQSAFSQILQSGLGQLNQPQYNPGQYQFDFNPIAQQAREGFQNRTIPSILERLTASGGQDSSALGHTLGQAGADLETNLASLGAQYGLQNRGQEAQIGLQSQGQRNALMSGLLSLGTQPQFESAYFPKQPGFAQSAGAGVAEAAPQLLLLLLQSYLQNKDKNVQG